jgi:hypothetical protein
LPNITFEPTKPVDLGTMLKNGCERITVIMVYHDMFVGAQQQGKKNIVTCHELIQKHVAEVKCQAEGTKIKKG